MKRFLFLFISLTLPAFTSAALLIKNGSVKRVVATATLSPEEHYNKAVEAWMREDWAEVVYQYRIVAENFPLFSSRHLELHFYLGAALYYYGEFEEANENLTIYLKYSCSPELLEEAMQYKFAVAEEYRCGAKRRLLGYHSLPKWVCGKTHALKIYDEIISTLPCHDLAAQALYSKGILFCELNEFSESVEALQSLIRRFPLDELAPQAYLTIIHVYLQQAYCEYQNPDILALAEITLRHFSEDFPNEERVGEAESCLKEMEEIFAYGLYEMGIFYGKVKRWQAAALYYSTAICQFPHTSVALHARECLDCLLKKYPYLDLSQELVDASSSS